MNKIINKTPHPVYILDNENRVVKVFPKSNGMIRVPEQIKNVGEMDGIPITTTKWGETTDVPKPRKDIFYIVSQLVKSALPHRYDFLVPKQIVRDKSGNIIGCKCLDIGETLPKNFKF